jgi:hypothetical protein
MGARYISESEGLHQQMENVISQAYHAGHSCFVCIFGKGDIQPLFLNATGFEIIVCA